WWSHVLFPGTDRGGAGWQPASSPGRLPTCPTRILFGFLLVVVAAGLLFFTRLHCPLLEPEEARYAEIPRQMLAEGNFAVPVVHGQPYFQKPPLLYWLVMGCYRVCGVHDWTARLVPGMAGLLIVLVTYGWGRQTLGPRPALAGAFIWC